MSEPAMGRGLLLDQTGRCLNSSTGYADPSLTWEITPGRSAAPSLPPLARP
jgi:hypothetical protein